MIPLETKAFIVENTRQKMRDNNYTEYKRIYKFIIKYL